MPVSTADIVKPMSYELNNSTLGWDVVVNYSCVQPLSYSLLLLTFGDRRDNELNKLLRQSYHNDPSGHLKALKMYVYLKLVFAQLIKTY